MPGVVETTNTFIANQVITSTVMNNIIDQTLFTSDALSGSTLALTAGKIKVATSGITSNEMANNAVTANAIAANAVTTSAIAANAVTADAIAANAVTTAKILESNVTTGKIADAAISAPKLNGAQTGTAPIFAARAFAKIKPNNSSGRAANFKSGNYSAAIGQIVTVTITNHGLRTDDRIRLVFTKTSGTGTVPSSSTFFTVTGVTNANTFTVAFSSAAVSSGTVIAEFITIQGSKNVSSASFFDSAANKYILNFTESMNDDNYITVVTSSNYPISWVDIGAEDTAGETQFNTARCCHFMSVNPTRFLNIVVFG